MGSEGRAEDSDGEAVEASDGEAAEALVEKDDDEDDIGSERVQLYTPCLHLAHICVI